MKHCPVCKARYTGKRQCHRCKADIGNLANIEAEAFDFREEALAAYQDGDYARMQELARRSCSLRKTPEAIRLRACAALLNGQFDQAVRLRSEFIRIL
jgi:hypothetical protein